MSLVGFLPLLKQARQLGQTPVLLLIIKLAVVAQQQAATPMQPSPSFQQQLVLVQEVPLQRFHLQLHSLVPL